MITFPSEDVPLYPCVLLLDTSKSMLRPFKADSGIEKIPINELNEALHSFQKTLIYENGESGKKNDYICDRIDVAIITFGGPPQVIKSFTRPDKLELPILVANGENTPMAEGIIKAIDVLVERKRYYDSNDRESRIPSIILMTDGRPTDRIDKQTLSITDKWKYAVEKVRQAKELIKAKEKTKDNDIAFVIFAYSTDKDCLSNLSEISHEEPKLLEKAKYKECLQLVSKTLIDIVNNQKDLHKEAGEW